MTTSACDVDPDAIVAEVVAFVEQEYTNRLPLLPGAVETVRALAARWPLGLASSSNRPIIELFLDASELRPCFTATVSSEEVAPRQAGAGRLRRGCSSPGGLRPNVAWRSRTRPTASEPASLLG